MNLESPHFDHALAGLARGRQRSRLAFIILLIITCMVHSSDCQSKKAEDQKMSNTDFVEMQSRKMPPMSLADTEATRIGRRSVVTFTGNVPEDFAEGSIMVADGGNLVSTTLLAGFYETTDVGQFLSSMRSGMDIRRVYWKYDALADDMYLGIDCYGLCGDVDGDDSASYPSGPFFQAGGTEKQYLAAPEFLYIGIDTDAPQTGAKIQPGLLIGSKPRQSSDLGYNDFGLFSTSSVRPSPRPSSAEIDSYFIKTNFTSLPRAIYPTAISSPILDPDDNFVQHSDNTSFGDLEFIIRRFSSLPGISWNSTSPVTPANTPGYGKISFSFVVYLGIHSELSPFIDVLPEYNSASSIQAGHQLVFECPFLPLDALGQCCPHSARDACDVCNGHNANLDPCGSCRMNASLVPASSCPGAVSEWAPIITTSDLFQNTSFATADINGDGIQDIIVGVPSLNLVMIHFLDSYGADVSVFNISNPNPFDAGTYDEFGYSISANGDINNDGTIDLFIGAPGYKNGTGIVYLAILTPHGNVSRWKSIESEYDQRMEYSLLCPPPELPIMRKDTSDASDASDAYSPTASSPNFGGPPEQMNVPPTDETLHSCLPRYDGARFGHSLSYLGRNLLLVGAPNSQFNDTSTPFSQAGALMLVGLATDGSAIGMYALSTKLANDSANAAGVNGPPVLGTVLGRLTRLAGTVPVSGQPTYRVITSIDWTLSSNEKLTTMMMFVVKTDGSIPFRSHILLPTAPLPLPNFPSSPILSQSKLRTPNDLPGYVPSSTSSLAGAGDIDGDGNPDMILGISYATGGYSTDLLLVCFLGSDAQVLRTQLIGAGGIGHFLLNATSGYQFGSFIHVTPSTKPIGGIVPAQGSVTVLTTAISTLAPMQFYVLSLWGTSAPSNPSTPLSPQVPTPPPIVNGGPPAGLPPGSIVAPSAQFPLEPVSSTDKLVLEFVTNTPTLKISTQAIPDIWTAISLDKIVERTTQGPYQALKTLYLPGATAWSRQTSPDGSQTTYSAKMVRSDGSPSNVDLQVQVITFSNSRTVVFSPSSYVGVTENSIKFSFLVRGWMFTQSKTVLDLHINVATNDPIITVSTDSSPTNGGEQFTRFILGSMSSATAIKIPTFATVDGVLANVSPPTFNQTSGQLILTAPPFFDTLFYDPDVTIKAVNSPTGIKKISPQRYLLVIIIISSIVGLILLVGLIFFLTVCVCRQKQAEKRWKDAGEISTV